MQAIKTAISIEKDLFEEVESIARTLKVSRSKLYGMALQDFIAHRKNQEMLARINAAYADEPDLSEQMLRRQSQRHQRRLLEGEW